MIASSIRIPQAFALRLKVYEWNWFVRLLGGSGRCSHYFPILYRVQIGSVGSCGESPFNRTSEMRRSILRPQKLHAYVGPVLRSIVPNGEYHMPSSHSR